METVARRYSAEPEEQINSQNFLSSVSEANCLEITGLTSCVSQRSSSVTVWPEVTVATYCRSLPFLQRQVNPS